jgi:endonuclease YncB( thermonuclease family)
MKHLSNIAAFLSVAWAVAQTVAAPPPDFRGTVTMVSDADTYVVTRRDGSPVKVRLHWPDAPEVAHNSKQVNQPGGLEAKLFAMDLLLRNEVDVHPVGESYGRIVADVALHIGASGTQDVACVLTGRGHAQLDPRFKPSARLVELEKNARKSNAGLWAAPGEPIPPWDWRKMTREEQRKHK